MDQIIRQLIFPAAVPDAFAQAGCDPPWLGNPLFGGHFAADTMLGRVVEEIFLHRGGSGMEIALLRER